MPAEPQAPPNASPKPLPRFGPFEIVQLLGRGGMAEVYKARVLEGPSQGRFVAIKRLNPQLASDPEAVGLFTLEAEVSRVLRHRCVVEVHEAGVLGGLHYLVMEYVDGRDLGLILARCRDRGILLPVPFCLFIARAVLEALGYAHLACSPEGVPLNIVHCDVSPSNVFVSRLGEIKLGDFGIAKVRGMGSAHVETQLWGKLAYLAPERLDRAPLQPRVDLWGVAMMLYECLSNRKALEAATNEELERALRAGRIAPVEEHRRDLPEGLGAVLQRALARDPEDRYPTAEAMSKALAPFHDEAVGEPLGIASVVRGLFRE